MEIAVFLAQCPVPNQGRQAKVEEFGKCVDCWVVCLCEAGAIETAENSSQLGVEDGGLVDVFLVGADYVWGGGVGVGEGRG